MSSFSGTGAEEVKAGSDDSAPNHVDIKDLTFGWQ